MAVGAAESWAYSDSCEHILKLVDQSDKCRVVDVDSDRRCQLFHWWLWETGTYE